MIFDLRDLRKQLFNNFIIRNIEEESGDVSANSVLK